MCVQQGSRRGRDTKAAMSYKSQLKCVNSLNCLISDMFEEAVLEERLLLSRNALELGLVAVLPFLPRSYPNSVWLKRQLCTTM